MMCGHNSSFVPETKQSFVSNTEMEVVSAQRLGDGVVYGANGAVVPESEAPPTSSPSDSQDFSLFFQEGFSGVLENILKYLSVKEMKAFSSTSREALDAVRNSKCFSDVVDFRISKDTVKSGVLKNCSFPWKRLDIQVSIGDGILETVTSLQFLESLRSLKIQVRYVTEQEFANSVKFLPDILIRTKALCELAVQPKTFKHLLEETTSNLELKQLLFKLNRLNLHFDIFGHEDYNEAETESLVPEFNLKTFSADINAKVNLNKVALKIVEQSKDTLEELDLVDAKWRGCGWNLIRCPKLRIANLSGISVECVQEVEMFLRNQPPLQEITVETDSPSRYLTALQGKVSKLRKLHIKVLGVEEEEGESIMSQDVDWRRIVENMEALEDFRIGIERNDCRKGAFMDAEEILRLLPASKLKRLCIVDTFKAYACLSQEVGYHISRFQNLTELEMEALPELDDAGLQEIIKGCPKLVTLALKDLIKVTDFGISGVAGGVKVGVSLGDLKDLVTLKIWGCWSLTLESIPIVVQFDSLRSFRLLHNVIHWQMGTPEVAVVRIFEQNPNLRELHFQVTNERKHRWQATRDLDLEKKMKEIYRQIEQVEIWHNCYGYDDEDATESDSESDDDDDSYFCYTYGVPFDLDDDDDPEANFADYVQSDS